MKEIEQLIKICALRDVELAVINANLSDESLVTLINILRKLEIKYKND